MHRGYKNPSKLSNTVELLEKKEPRLRDIHCYANAFATAAERLKRSKLLEIVKLQKARDMKDRTFLPESVEYPSKEDEEERLAKAQDMEDILRADADIRNQVEQTPESQKRLDELQKTPIVQRLDVGDLGIRDTDQGLLGLLPYYTVEDTLNALKLPKSQIHNLRKVVTKVAEQQTPTHKELESIEKLITKCVAIDHDIVIDNDSYANQDEYYEMKQFTLPAVIQYMQDVLDFVRNGGYLAQPHGDSEAVSNYAYANLTPDGIDANPGIHGPYLIGPPPQIPRDTSNVQRGNIPIDVNDYLSLSGLTQHQSLGVPIPLQTQKTVPLLNTQPVVNETPTGPVTSMQPSTPLLPQTKLGSAPLTNQDYEEMMGMNDIKVENQLIKLLGLEPDVSTAELIHAINQKIDEIQNKKDDIRRGSYVSDISSMNESINELNHEEEQLRYWIPLLEKEKGLAHKQSPFRKVKVTHPSPKAPEIINPQTKRAVQVGSKKYKQLVRTGVINESSLQEAASKLGRTLPRVPPLSKKTMKNVLEESPAFLRAMQRQHQPLPAQHQPGYLRPTVASQTRRGPSGERQSILERPLRSSESYQARNLRETMGEGMHRHKGLTVTKGGSFGKLKFDMNHLPRLHLLAKKGKKIVAKGPISHHLYELLTKRFDHRKKYSPESIQQFKELARLAEIPQEHMGRHDKKGKILRGETIDGQGIKSKLVLYNGPEDLLKLYDRLIGSWDAGSRSDQLKSELSEVLDKLHEGGVISQHDYENVMHSLL